LKVEYHKRFLKELSRIPSHTRSKIERFAFEELPNAISIHDTQKIEQMKGYPTYYKVRFGEYRVGLKLKDDLIIFERALHRRDIYRYFP